MLATIRKRARFLAKSPLHPQWLHRSNSDGYKLLISGIAANQTVLDIGCFNKWAKQHLQPGCEYVGLDYYETASQWYHSVPDVYGDALSLPLAPASFDAVILIDVLEHIKDSRRLLDQIHGVLKPGGKVIMSLPFLYPLHDAPRDYVRLTIHGIENLAEQSQFDIELCEPVGSPIVTAAFLFNVSLSKTVINWISARSIWSIFALIVPPIILINNLLARFVSRFEISDGFMANSYQVILVKR
jgi:SAM-dependent methyltransferase